MLSNEQIDALEWRLKNIQQAISEYVIEYAGRILSNENVFNQKLLYQARRAKALGVDMDELHKGIAEWADTSIEEVIAMFDETARAHYEDEAGRLAPAPDYANNEAVQRIVRTQAKLAGEAMQNITGTIGMVDTKGNDLPLKDFYQKTMDWVFQSVSSGALNYDEAIRLAAEAMADADVQVVDYESGVRTTIEAAVRRNIFGGLGKMMQEITEEVHRQLGANGWEISAHADSAPDHEPIQGRQFTDAEYKEKITDPPNVREIGDFHCKHMKFSIIAGVTPPVHSEEELRKFIDDNAEGHTIDGKHYTGYGARQAMRRREQQLRRKRRRFAFACGNGDKKLMERYGGQLHTGMERYKRFAKGAGLRPQMNRLFTVGYTRKHGAALAAVVRRKAI